MRNVLIVGGNSFARECFYYVRQMEKVYSDLKFKGFLGHHNYGNASIYKNLSSFYLGDITDYIIHNDDVFVIGASSPAVREIIYNDLKNLGCNFINISLQEFWIDNGSSVGEANVFVPPFSPVCEFKIGNGNIFNGSVVVGHDVEIGNFNFFAPRSQILGFSKIGNLNSIGANSIVLPKAKIGNNNIIAPLSAVYKGCKDNTYLLGNPATIIGKK